MRIIFGTDGWRGIIAKDFTFANLRRVSAAVARYLVQQGKANRGIVIAHDTRFLAEDFAREVAAVITGHGIGVWLAAGPCPTPVAASAILDKQAAGAIMLTASHNPPEYSGFKYIPEYAGPALPHITDRIVALIEEEPELPKPNPELVQSFDPMPAYFRLLAKQVDMDKIRHSGLKFVVNPMHGAGIGYLERLLGDQGLDVQAQRNWRDPLFGGLMPEPKAALLTDLQQAVAGRENTLGLALDGDADRFGIIDETGTYLVPNQVLTLLAVYLTGVRNLRGPIARTVATTTLLDRIARSYGNQVIETPVGFKYQAQAMLEQGAILAGEESGGLSIAGHIPEKDGILACLLMAEVSAHYQKPLSLVMDEVYREYGKLFTNRLDFRCSPAKKQQVLTALAEFSPAEIGGIEVTDVVTNDGWKYILADGSWLLVRASGTEAVFRVYGEAADPDQLRELQLAVAAALDLR